MSTVIGLDVGTSGVRALAVSEEGTVLASAQAPITSERSSDGSIHEQAPGDWWLAVCGVCKQVARGVSVSGVGVTSTSGSLVLVDETGAPLRNAIMYDDSRASAVSTLFRVAGFPDVNASYSLAKAAWVRTREPEIWSQVRHVLHPADWLAGRLSGRFGVSDYCNALKLGFDPESMQWTDAPAAGGLAGELLPEVVPPGSAVGGLCAQAAEESGLAKGTPVVLAATDGIADLVASGARQPGDTNTTLGTTIVWKALCLARPTASPGIYSHRHPGGWWAPGAAGNSGPGSLKWDGEPLPPDERDRRACRYFPTPVIAYPLRAAGERFPFHSPSAREFMEGCPASEFERYAAQLQAIAFIERWGYERLNASGIATDGTTYSGGRASASEVLAQLRATTLGRPVCRCEYPEAAFGAAILTAASVFHRGDVTAAIRAMTRPAVVTDPSPDLISPFEELYRQFRAACLRRGYGE